MKVKKKKSTSFTAVRLRDFTATSSTMERSEYGHHHDRDVTLAIQALNVRPFYITGRNLEAAVAEGLEAGLWAVFSEDEARIVEVEE